MEKLDQAYLTDLVRGTQSGNSNSAAELYAATSHRIFAYLWFMCRDPREAESIFREVVIRIIAGAGGLDNPALFLPWVTRICLRRFMERTEKAGALRIRPEDSIATPAGTYTVTYILNLPLTESQVLMMKYAQGLTDREIGDLLNSSRSMTKRYIRTAERHLRGERGAANGQIPRQVKRDAALNAAPELDSLKSAVILEQAFDECGWKPNTIPVEALASYTVYRKERFSLQRGILTALLMMFLLLPVCFILPRFDVSLEEKGERGLPVYSIQVHSLLPVNRVIAELNARHLPVYEGGAGFYTVEPTRNGNLRLTVELLNRQKRVSDQQVTAVDNEGPKLTGSEIGDDTVLLIVKDAGIGVDYYEISAVTASGGHVEPLRIDREKGEILYPYPEEDWDVYIPDHIGNMLHLSLTLEQETEEGT